MIAALNAASRSSLVIACPLHQLFDQLFEAFALAVSVGMIAAPTMQGVALA
jgi:hypothetical protein